MTDQRRSYQSEFARGRRSSLGPPVARGESVRGTYRNTSHVPGHGPRARLGKKDGATVLVRALHALCRTRSRVLETLSY